MRINVREVAHELARHPIRNVVLRWNWKSAVLSPLSRAGLIFAVNLTSGSGPAFAALAMEALYRGAISGFCGAIIEAFSVADPYWAGQLMVLVVVPLLSDVIDFLLHWFYGTPHPGRSLEVSLMWSTLSTAFSYFAMRRGTLIVGERRKTLFQDLVMLPSLLIAFLAMTIRQTRMMFFKGTVLILIILMAPVRAATAQSAQGRDLPQVDTLLEQMRTHDEWQQGHLIQYSVQRTFRAVNVRFNLESLMEVRTIFRQPDVFTSDIVRSEGSTLIRERVFDKILEAERDARTKESQQTAINPHNYSFKVLSEEDCGGRKCYRMRVIPKRKDRFSIDGYIWVDAADGAIARIQGSPARRPSFWTQHTEIERRYKRVDGVWLCDTMESSSDIFIGGHSVLKVDHLYTVVRTQ